MVKVRRGLPEEEYSFHSALANERCTHFPPSTQTKKDSLIDCFHFYIKANIEICLLLVTQSLDEYFRWSIQEIELYFYSSSSLIQSGYINVGSIYYTIYILIN